MHETVCNIRVTFGLCSNCSFNVWIYVFAAVKIEFNPFYIEFNIIFNVVLMADLFSKYCPFTHEGHQYILIQHCALIID